MIFTNRKWNDFCKKLSEEGIHSIPLCEINEKTGYFFSLKHDVETNVKKAFKIAETEQKYGHRGSYYIQAYLMKDERNILLLKKMQAMGHEISYHYDVMDSNKGDIVKALEEFDNNLNVFIKNGFHIKTVCQHGNPIVERNGYTSNRDFFRNEKIQKKYPDISDIMVNYKQKNKIDYLYFSDAGRKFKLIFVPVNNDLINSDDKNIEYNDIEELFREIKERKSIVSIHPHRWESSAIAYYIKAELFKIVKLAAKSFIKIPLCKRIMSRYYYLAKKI